MYDNLLIFRESSIELIRPAGSGTYVTSTLSSNIGTTATNAISVVQGLGVVFLSYDGIYLFEGGLLGGSKVSIVRISDPIQKELNRISKGSLAKAAAAYSDKEKEWWCLYPVDGETVATRSVVLHTLNNTWSFRNNNGDSGIFVYSDINTLPNGWFILSPRQTVLLNTPAVGQATVQPSGLMIWSAIRTARQDVVYTIGENASIVSLPTQDPLFSEWESAWLDFGSDRPDKRIITVEVEILTQGHNEIELLSAVNYRDDRTSSGSRPTAEATLYGTTEEDSLFHPGSSNFDKSLARIGTSLWGEQKTTRLRWDINTGLVSWYRFTIRSRNLFQIVSYNITYTTSDNNTLNIKAGERKTI